jgi:hypothetical protein
MKKLSKDSESRILTALESVADSVNDGMLPNAAIVKSATEHEIPAGHVNLMVSAYNTGRTGKQRMAADNPFDKAATFELADPQDIMSKLYPTNIKTAAQKHDETVVDTEYSQAPAFARHKAASAVAARKVNWKLVDKAPEEYSGEEHTAIKRAFHTIEFNKRRFEACRRELSHAQDLLSSSFEKLSTYFRTPGGVSFAAACNAVEIQHGGMGSAVMRQVARSIPQSTQGHQKQASFVEVQPDQAPWSIIKEAIKLASSIHANQSELDNLAQHVIKKAEAEILPFDQRPGKSILGLALPTTNEKQSSMAPLYGAGAGLAGGGLLHYLKNKDKDEDEERSSLLGDLALPTAGGLFGGLAYDYATSDAGGGEEENAPYKPVDHKPVDPDNPNGPGSKNWAAADEAAAQGFMQLDDDEALMGVAPRGEALTPGKLPGNPIHLDTVPYRRPGSPDWAPDDPYELQRDAVTEGVDVAPSLLDQIGKTAGEKQAFGSLYALSHLLGKSPRYQRGVSAELDAEDEKVQDYIEELDSPTHADDLKRIRIRAQLENMMANDATISTHDPAMVSEAYNEIVQLSPSAADSPLLMRNLLRQYLVNGGEMDPRDISSNILGNEKALQDVQQGRPGLEAPGAGVASLTAGADKGFKTEDDARDKNPNPKKPKMPWYDRASDRMEEGRKKYEADKAAKAAKAKAKAEAEALARQNAGNPPATAAI